MTDDELLELARQVLTEKQLRAWELAEKKMSERAIAYAMGISRGTVRDHLEAATRRLAEAAAST